MMKTLHEDRNQARLIGGRQAGRTIGPCNGFLRGLMKNDPNYAVNNTMQTPRKGEFNMQNVCDR